VNFRWSVIIAELWRPEVVKPKNFVSNFCVFFGKTTQYGKIFKILFRKFLPTLLCSNVVKCIRRVIGEIVRYLPDQKNKISAASQTVTKCADRAENQCSSLLENVFYVFFTFHKRHDLLRFSKWCIRKS